MDDLISRQAAIEALNEQIEQCDKALSSFDISMKDEYAVKVERASLVAYKEQLEFLPSAQPEIIRFRECRYNDMPPTAGNAGCTLLYGMTNQNGFCSLAERREVDDHETD